MWRPLEVLLYDWWPLIDERRQVRRILAAPISIRYDGVTASVGGHRDTAAPRNEIDRSALSGATSQIT